MSDTCETCGQVVSKAETLPEIYAALKKHYFPDRWEDIELSGPADVANLGEVSVVGVSDNINDDPGYLGLDIFVVFQVGQEFYRLNGEMSSYAGRSWEGHLTPVSKKEKKVIVYE